MRKKSVLLASVSLALLVGLVGMAVVWAQSGAEENPPHAVARALTEEELAAGEEMQVHYFDSYEEAMEFTGASPADFQAPAAGDADEQDKHCLVQIEPLQPGQTASKISEPVCVDKAIVSVSIQVPPSEGKVDAEGSAPKRVPGDEVPAEVFRAVSTATILDANCNLTKYGVQPIARGTFYGNMGGNTTTDPTVCNDYTPNQSVFVNSIYVFRDGIDGVELGWYENPDEGRVFFGVRVMDGVYQKHTYGSVSPNTNHTYKLVSEIVPGGDKQWKYYIDGSLREVWFHQVDVGPEIAAAQERHSRYDSGQTHWWNLKYANYYRNFYNWPNWNRVDDNDPDYRCCKISNTQFWVKTSCN